MIGIKLGLKGQQHILGDSSVSAFLAATGITGTTQVNAITNLVANLKNYGLWSKMNAIYPFVSDTYNLSSYTEDFANAGWNNTASTITANSITAPNGTLTADTMQNNTTGSYIAQVDKVNNAGTFTQSVYFKKGNNNWASVYTSDNGSNYAIGYFNINTGVVGTAAAVGNFTSPSVSISNAGNGWYRCSLTFTKPSTATSYATIFIPNTDNTFTRTAGQNVYIWGNQLETGVLTTYQPIATTPAARFVSQFKYNLKDPRDLNAAFRLSFSGSWVYSQQGATSNGVNAYARTYFVPSANLIAASQSSSLYSRTNVASTSNSFDLSSVTTGVGNFSLSIDAFVAGIHGFVRYGITQDVRILTAQRNDGYFVGSRTSATMLKLYRSNVILGTTTTADSGISTTEVPLGVESVNGILSGYSAKQYAFCHMGDGLTDTQASNLYTSIQAFQVELSRQV